MRLRGELITRADAEHAMEQEPHRAHIDRELREGVEDVDHARALIQVLRTLGLKPMISVPIELQESVDTSGIRHTQRELTSTTGCVVGTIGREQKAQDGYILYEVVDPYVKVEPRMIGDPPEFHGAVSFPQDMQPGALWKVGAPPSLDSANFSGESYRKAVEKLAVGARHIFGALEEGVLIKDIPKETGIPPVECLRHLVQLAEAMGVRGLPEFSILSLAKELGLSADRLLYADEPGTLNIPSDLRGVTATRLQETLALSGVLVSLPRAKRAQETGVLEGYYVHPATRLERRISRHGYVRLTEEEQAMSTQELAECLGISQPTATNAQKRGWFELTDGKKGNKDKVLAHINPERIEHGVLPYDK